MYITHGCILIGNILAKATFVFFICQPINGAAMKSYLPRFGDSLPRGFSPR
jgi:hypothetical protein